MELLATFTAPVTIAGNININLNRDGDPDADKFNTVLKTFNMVKHVSSPTHELIDLLDAKVAGEGHTRKDIEVEQMGLSGHMLITWSIDMSLPLSKYIRISRRSWMDFNIDNYQRELHDSELSNRTAADRAVTEREDSVDTLVERFNTVVINLLDKAAPVTEMTTRERHHQPWFDAESRSTHRVVRELERRLKTKRSGKAPSAW